MSQNARGSPMVVNDAKVNLYIPDTISDGADALAGQSSDAGDGGTAT